MSGSRSTRPDGGMFLWGRLSDGRSATDLLPKAVEQGHGLRARRALLLGAARRVDVRMSFATASAEELDEGVRRFAAALNA